jgi:hypothetical protein
MQKFFEANYLNLDGACFGIQKIETIAGAIFRYFQSSDVGLLNCRELRFLSYALVKVPTDQPPHVLETVIQGLTEQKFEFDIPEFTFRDFIVGFVPCNNIYAPASVVIERLEFEKVWSKRIDLREETKQLRFVPWFEECLVVNSGDFAVRKRFGSRLEIRFFLCKSAFL